MTEDSPIVQEVRRRAMLISARFGHDPRKYLARIIHTGLFFTTSLWVKLWL